MFIHNVSCRLVLYLSGRILYTKLIPNWCYMLFGEILKNDIIPTTLAGLDCQRGRSNPFLGADCKILLLLCFGKEIFEFEFEFGFEEVRKKGFGEILRERRFFGGKGLGEGIRYGVFGLVGNLVGFEVEKGDSEGFRRTENMGVFWGAGWRLGLG